jgi:hypothetical protein
MLTIGTSPAKSKEVLMQRIDRYRRPEQLSLFHPTRILPPWTDLPAESREVTLTLIVKMLRNHHLRTSVEKERGETANE